MKPRRTPSSNFVFRLPGGTEDNDLWCRRDVDDADQPVICSVWKPTEAERERLVAGDNVELVVWGEGTPPVALRVTDEQPGTSTEGGSA